MKANDAGAANAPTDNNADLKPQSKTDAKEVPAADLSTLKNEAAAN